MGLILPQTVEIRTNSLNYKYYSEKGYDFKKCGDSIKVNILDLYPGSFTKVKCICDVCKKEIKIKYRDVLENKKNNRLIICNNPICIKRKSEDTCMKKYKVKCSLQSKEIRDKGIQTLKEKYGEDITNAFQATDVKEKIKQTNREKYGTDYATQNKEIQDKIKETNNKKYGVDCYTQTKEYKDKARKTCQLHYGVDNPSQSQEIKDKKVETCRKHFGVDHSFQSDEVRDKSAKTLEEKYGKGIINVSQVKEIQDKMKTTFKEHYGVDNPAKSDIVQNKIKTTNQERYGCTCSLQAEEVKKKAKETLMKNHGVEHALQNKEIYDRMKATCKEKYGNENYFASDDFKNKTRDIWSFNGHDGPCSRQQKYLANLVNGKINAVISGYWADVVLENEKIDLEYDGGGHRANCDFYHKVTSKEFDLKEKIREENICKKGYKIIRIISKRDNLPSDEVILNLVEGFKNSDFEVIRIDIDEGTIDKDYQEKWYCNFGKLRRISQKDLDKFEKQEKDTSEN